MSWLARSIVNSLRGEDADEDADDDNLRSELNVENSDKSPINRENEQQAGEEEEDDPTRGVKEDLSELTKTLTRQFWGVASFLAPPPTSGDTSPADQSQRLDPAASDEADAESVISPRLAGIRSDFAEIGGRFRTGISILSNTKAVSEISKLASTLLPFGSDEEDDGESEEVEGKYEGGAVGVTDEVLAFARNISMHPKTWLDFPLIADEDDDDDFEMSDAQQEHALAIEHLAPSLAALRIELCPIHMSEGRFWKIYFVLLHSRLNRPDAELLTTPQIVQARERLLQDLQNRKKPSSGASGSGTDEPSLPNEVDESASVERTLIPPFGVVAETSLSKTPLEDHPCNLIPMIDVETEKHPVDTTEVKIIDKSVIEEDPPVQTRSTELEEDPPVQTRSTELEEEPPVQARSSELKEDPPVQAKSKELKEDPPVQAKSKELSSDSSNRVTIHKYVEDGDDWLEEESTYEAGPSRGTTVPLGNDEDVSFSDLEDDDDEGISKSSRTVGSAGDSKPKDSKEGWIQLRNSEAAVKSGNNSASTDKNESSDWLNIDDLDDV